MNQKFIFLFLCVVSLSEILVCEVGNASQLVVGDHIRYASEADNPSVCKIIISRFRRWDRTGLCSGTLIPSDTEFAKLTSDQHCFGRNFNPNDHQVTVECGGRRVPSPIEIQLPDSNNNELWEQVEDQEGGSDLVWLLKKNHRADDFAVLSLPKNGKDHPYATSLIATGPEKYFFDFGSLKPGVECKIMGYGINDIRDRETRESNEDNSGSLVEGSLIGVNITYFKFQKLIQISAEKNQNLSTSVAGGDSGGPLFCKVPGGEIELMGTLLSRINAADPVDASYPKAVLNFVIPIWSHIQPKPVVTSPTNLVFLGWPGYDPNHFEYGISPFSLLGPDLL